MGKLTNNSNLPAALVKALENDPYSAGDSDFTATSLIKPARISALEKRHAHEIEEDAEDGLYRLYGQVAHGILERANMADLAEKRFFISVEVGGKSYKVSAQIDTLSLIDSLLTDFKFTTSWGFQADKAPKADWVAQLNIQAELLRQNGYEPQSLRIVGLLRDWQYREAKSKSNYPQSPVATHDIPMWSSEQTLAFIKMRIAAHLDAAKDLPDCDDEERYTKDPEFAVMRPGRKTSLKNEGTEEAARAWMAANPDKSKGAKIEFRQGKRTRCMFYCPVAQFCTQWKKEQGQSTDEESESA